MEGKHAKSREIVKKELEESSPAHDINHVMRVCSLCLHLAKCEPDADLDVLRTAAIPHDIARVREGRDVDHATLGAEMSEKILRELAYPEEKIKLIKHCIIAHTFRSRYGPKTIEAKILFDADELDVIGAIGVARSFILAGEYGQRVYSDTPIDEYIKENLVGGKFYGRIKDPSKHAPNIEFETKFRRIPSKLYTRKAREIARHRLEYMERFFERLKEEINGKR